MFFTLNKKSLFSFILCCSFSPFVYGHSTCQQTFTRSIEKLEKDTNYWRSRHLKFNKLAEDTSISYYWRQYWRLEAEHAAKRHLNIEEQIAKILKEQIAKAQN